MGTYFRVKALVGHLSADYVVRVSYLIFGLELTLVFFMSNINNLTLSHFPFYKTLNWLTSVDAEADTILEQLVIQLSFSHCQCSYALWQLKTESIVKVRIFCCQLASNLLHFLKIKTSSRATPYSSCQSTSGLLQFCSHYPCSRKLQLTLSWKALKSLWP